MNLSEIIYVFKPQVVTMTCFFLYTVDLLTALSIIHIIRYVIIVQVIELD